MVFKHEIDPSFGKDIGELQKIHTPPPIEISDEDRPIMC